MQWETIIIVLIWLVLGLLANLSKSRAAKRQARGTPADRKRTGRPAYKQQQQEDESRQAVQQQKKEKKSLTAGELLRRRWEKQMEIGAPRRDPDQILKKETAAAHIPEKAEKPKQDTGELFRPFRTVRRIKTPARRAGRLIFRENPFVNAVIAAEVLGKPVARKRRKPYRRVDE